MVKGGPMDLPPTYLTSKKPNPSSVNVVLCKAKSKGQPDSNIFLWIAASIADAAAVNPNGIKTLLANGLRTFYY